MHVTTSGAGVAPGDPCFTRRVPASVAAQNMRTPDLLKFCGAELATNAVFTDPPPAAKPAAKNVYPSLPPELITLSRIQACVTSAVQAPAGLPKVARSGAKPTAEYVLL